MRYGKLRVLLQDVRQLWMSVCVCVCVCVRERESLDIYMQACAHEPTAQRVLCVTVNQDALVSSCTLATRVFIPISPCGLSPPSLTSSVSTAPL